MLPTITRLRATSSLKTKMALLSFFINHCFTSFCIKFTIYKKSSNFSNEQKIFQFYSLRYLNSETLLKRFSQKRKFAIFFQLEIFVDKTIFNFHSFKKVNDFVTIQYTTAILYPFYLKP